MYYITSFDGPPWLLLLRRRRQYAAIAMRHLQIIALQRNESGYHYWRRCGVSQEVSANICTTLSVPAYKKQTSTPRTNRVDEAPRLQVVGSSSFGWNDGESKKNFRMTKTILRLCADTNPLLFITARRCTYSLCPRTARTPCSSMINCPAVFQACEWDIIYVQVCSGGNDA